MTKISYNFIWEPDIHLSPLDAVLKVPSNILMNNLKYFNSFWETGKMVVSKQVDILDNRKFFENISYPFNISLESYFFLMMAGCRAIYIVPAPPVSFYK